MILVFPDLDTFRLVLTASVVPADVSLAPAKVSTDADGRLFVETDGKLPKKAKDELDRLKVVGAKRQAGEPEPVTSWLQVLPLTPDATPPQLSSQAPVLFELASAELMPAVVTEMLRLGNDRQGYRWLAPADRAADLRVLLRVIGPPYYTLLRALDTSPAEKGAVRAYTEQAPRVWVELGHTHPFARQIKLDEGQLLLVRAPRDWAFLPDAPFQDVYDILQFTLPAAPTGWTEAPVADKITVPLRLVAGNAADVPELWVVRGEGVRQLDRLVRDADDRLTEQLTFAVAKSPAGEQTVVLRTRPSKRQPPVLALDDAVGFKPYWRLPNLFVPAGKRLHPTLRRDAVSRLLADDRDQLVWLFPGENGSFTPESLPEDSFRPLGDWVEYVIDTHRADLATWVEATTFDFDTFVCTEGNQPKPKGPGDKQPKDRKGGKEDDADAVKPTAVAKAGGKKAEAGASTFAAPVLEVKPPSEWKVRCDELERQFLALDGPLDAPERQALWPELATANAGIGEERRAEAAVCWANALWERATLPREWVEGWFRTEQPDARYPVTAEQFDARLKPTPHPPTQSQARAVLVGLLAAAAQAPVPDWLRSRLPAVQRYLEQNEDRLPIRGAWLAAVRMAQLAGADVLGLARVRDRLLNRLLERGLNPEQDLPGFLRYAGLKDSQRVRAVRERAVEIHRAAREWVEKSLKPASPGQTQQDTVCTPAYLDLMFAFGLAKLGEASDAQRLADHAKKVLDVPVPKGGDPTAVTRALASGSLYRAFRYRVDAAVAGKPHAGLLPAELLDELDALQRKSQSVQPNDPAKLASYVIDRMREQSQILEPQEKLDPYAAWMKHGDDLRKELAELPKEKDLARLGRRIRELMKDGVKGKATAETRFAVLLEALPLSARVGQELTVELLAQVPAVLRAAPAGGGAGASAAPADLPKKQGQLLERALFLAAHFDKTELVQQLVDQFVEYVRAKPDDQRFELVNVVAGQCLKSLRKVGLTDAIDTLLRRMQDEVLKGKTLPQLKQQYAGKPDLWSDVLQTLLNLAAGWLTFGLTEQAAAALDAARAEILAGGPKMQPIRFTRLCQTYAAAVGQGPAEAGMPRLLELFRKLEPGRIPNSFTTAPYYSRLHLNLVEAVVQAIVSDDFALGQAGRRWLDEDEYLVRRRIHRDMRQLVSSSGL